jgi:hypothetical protein
VREAGRFRQQAHEMDARLQIYERLFGGDSDWVSGTRLLADSYRQAADEHERLARGHLETLRRSRKEP